MESKNTKDRVREQALGYIGAALGLVAGLAWNDAIKAMIEELYPTTRDTLIAKFVYAVAVTVLVVLLIKVISKALRKED